MSFAAVLTLSFSLLRLPDLAGQLQPVFQPQSAATVLLFVRSDCPNTNRYAPELAQLAARFQTRHVPFVLIYSDRQESAAAIRRHVATYHLLGQILRDPHAEAARLAQATVTPEAAVFDSRGRLAYHGRIDDRFVALGVSRPDGPQQHDLQQALEAVLAHRQPDPAATPAVGCALADLR